MKWNDFPEVVIEPSGRAVIKFSADPLADKNGRKVAEKLQEYGLVYDHPNKFIGIPEDEEKLIKLMSLPRIKAKVTRVELLRPEPQPETKPTDINSILAEQAQKIQELAEVLEAQKKSSAIAFSQLERELEGLERG